MQLYTGCGSVWLERVVWDHEAAGSNPVTPMFIRHRKPAWLLGLRFLNRTNDPKFWLRFG